MTLAAHVPALAAFVPDLGLDLLPPSDKENLAVYRVVHLLALGLLFTYFVPRDWPALHSNWLQPVMKCGEEWLASSASACSCPLPDISC